MDSIRVASRLFSSTIGETATNKGYSFGLNSITYELKLIGVIGSAIYVFSKFEIISLQDSMKESEARTSNHLQELEARTSNHLQESEARTSNNINQIKVDMKSEMKEIKVDMKSEMKESEARMRNEITLSEERIKYDVKASEVRIFQKIDDAFAGKKPPP